MRAVVDTNVYISFLLKPGSDHIPTRIVEYAFTHRFSLCVCSEQIEELERAVTTKPFLEAHINPADLEVFVARLCEHAAVMEALPNVAPGSVRDPKDMYLIVHATEVHANYLITGDRDLLVLERVGNVRILTPAEFVFLIEIDVP